MLRRLLAWLLGRSRGAPARPGLLDPAAFTRAVADHIAGRYPGVRAAVRDALSLTVLHQDHHMDVHLANAYRAYRQEPARAEAIIARYVEGLLGRPETRFTAAMARERLLPRILDEATCRRFGSLLVTRPLAPGLVVAYVVDEADRMTYVTGERLAQWDMLPADVHRIAMENLEAITSPGQMERYALGGGHVLLAVTAADGYAASRLLLADRLVEWAGPLPGRPLFALPARDHLYLWGDGDPVVTEAVERLAQEAWATAPYPITPALYQYSRGRVLPYREG